MDKDKINIGNIKLSSSYTPLFQSTLVGGRLVSSSLIAS